MITMPLQKLFLRPRRAKPLRAHGAVLGSSHSTVKLRHRRWIRIWGVILPGGLAAGILTALLYASQELRASIPSSTQEPFNVERYRQVLHQMGLSQVDVERDETGVLTLRGQCWRGDALEPFLNQLIQAEVLYRNQVICQDALQRSVAYILAAYGYQYARVAPGPTLGTVAITGDIHADQRWFSVNRQFNRLPGLHSWFVTHETNLTTIRTNTNANTSTNIPPAVDLDHQHTIKMNRTRSTEKTEDRARTAVRQTTSVSEPDSLLSALFRATSRFSGWLGLTDVAGYWSLKALSVTLQGSVDESYVATMSRRYGVPLNLVHKIIWIESRGRHLGSDSHILTSSKGALGIMQLMPNTAKELSVDPLDIRDNIRGGLMYLAQLSRKYNGDWDKAVAAYNWGQGNLDTAVARYGDHWQHALPQESAAYLLQVQR